MAEGFTKPDPAQWTKIVDKVLTYWRGRVDSVVLADLRQVGLTRLYLEADRWNGTGKWPAYVRQRIKWEMLSWIGDESKGPRSRKKREEMLQALNWKDHPELPRQHRVDRLELVIGESSFTVHGLPNAEDGDSDDDHRLDLVDESPNPEEEQISRDRQQLANDLLQLLPPNLLRVVSLRLGGQNIRQVSKELGIAPRTATKRYALGLELMRVAANQRGIEGMYDV